LVLYIYLIFLYLTLSFHICIYSNSISLRNRNLLTNLAYASFCNCLYVSALTNSMSFPIEFSLTFSLLSYNDSCTSLSVSSDTFFSIDILSIMSNLDLNAKSAELICAIMRLTLPNTYDRSPIPTTIQHKLTVNSIKLNYSSLFYPSEIDICSYRSSLYKSVGCYSFTGIE